MEYAIVDIETAGGNPKGGGITEIAVVIHDGEKIIQEYQTLLNPEMVIPTYITGLTGIDDFMVRHEPKFQDIQAELWELLKDRVFIAHSVNFDFGFIREAFLKEGKDLKSPKLCTVRLSRKVFPGLKSYSLGRICENQKIPITARHRAMGDAMATAILFDRMIKQAPDIVLQSLKKNSGETFLPPNFPNSKFKEIPDQCGIYYMLNEKGKVIYVGKAVNIRERFKNHFSGNVLPHLKQKLKAEVVDLQWKLSGTEFLALLMEVLEIKRLWPEYNSALKLPKTMWGLFHYEDGSGYGRFQISKVTRHLQPVESFFSLEEATLFLKEAMVNFQLCPKLSGLRKVSCSQESEQQCSGACKNEEDHVSYNQKVNSFLNQIKISQKEILLEFEGREKSEKAYCVFDRGVLTKFGFIKDLDEKGDLISRLESVPRIPETYYILRQFFPKFQADQIRILESI
ncbi:MAG: exonuclease domain-containing protein [Algoriphagus sp.]|uniref:exonuclease domain-containing protein n=1 Tax=Algoriphagus sp. TaxID=1872435 RepID=UPI002630972C|nr:exonuclease domain-containing protein [Algoriphagus sp.]MDG1278468.1 exonuclease domain-containing protein [Algoriphagus sp.]